MPIYPTSTRPRDTISETLAQGAAPSRNWVLDWPVLVCSSLFSHPFFPSLESQSFLDPPKAGCFLRLRATKLYVLTKSSSRNVASQSYWPTLVYVSFSHPLFLPWSPSHFWLKPNPTVYLTWEPQNLTYLLRAGPQTLIRSHTDPHSFIHSSLSNLRNHPACTFLVLTTIFILSLPLYLIHSHCKHVFKMK